MRTPISSSEHKLAQSSTKTKANQHPLSPVIMLASAAILGGRGARTAAMATLSRSMGLRALISTQQSPRRAVHQQASSDATSASSAAAAASLVAIAGLLSMNEIYGKKSSIAQMEISACHDPSSPSSSTSSANVKGGTTTQVIKPNTTDPSKQDFNQPPPRPDLPTISLSEVQEHNDESSLWYTFRGGVYDMTSFIQGHPGGLPRLLMAAGQDLEPYW